MKKFVPDSVVAPSGLETKEFRIRVLTINDVVKDYDAVMSSINHLKGVFGPHDPWPEDDLTIEQDLVDLGWHQKEFEIGSSFAYTVVNLDESRCLGCVYVDPSDKAGYDARVVCWVRQSELSNGFDEKLFSTIKSWLSDEWWFANIAFPGRMITWQDWDALPEI